MKINPVFVTYWRDVITPQLVCLGWSGKLGKLKGGHGVEPTPALPSEEELRLNRDACTAGVPRALDRVGPPNASTALPKV